MPPLVKDVESNGMGRGSISVGSSAEGTSVLLLRKAVLLKSISHGYFRFPAKPLPPHHGSSLQQQRKRPPVTSGWGEERIVDPPE